MNDPKDPKDLGFIPSFSMEDGMTFSDFEKERKLNELKVKRSIPLLGTDFLLTAGPHIWCGPTGKGKTTLSASQIAWFIENDSSRKAVALLNEETPVNFILRVACILERVNFMDYRDGKLDESIKAQVLKRVELNFKRLVVPRHYDFTIMEECLEVIRTALGQGGFVVLDYLQSVTTSRANPDLTPYEVSRKFGEELKKLGQSAMAPLLIMAQCHPGDEPLARRVQGNHTFVNHMESSAEISTDYGRLTTTIRIDKHRWGSMQGRKIILDFDNGRLVVVGAGNSNLQTNDKNTNQSDDGEWVLVSEVSGGESDE